MTGYLRANNINISEGKVGKPLQKINPQAQHRRAQGAGRSLNPKVYKAAYFGQKLHMDQNEKLAMFGVTYVCARDEYSGAIVGYAVMSIKNNKVIYNENLK